MVHIPAPVPGLVIRYAYLWTDEYDAGRDEGVKDRPAAVVLAQRDNGGKLIVVVVPVTHSPPTVAADALEIPQGTKRRLGLDDDRSWIVLTETNVFAWPGPDLRPLADEGTIAYGLLPANLFRELRSRLTAKIAAGQLRRIPRSE
jgi:hypothetical protein